MLILLNILLGHVYFQKVIIYPLDNAIERSVKLRHRKERKIAYGREAL